MTTSPVEQKPPAPAVEKQGLTTIMRGQFRARGPTRDEVYAIAQAQKVRFGRRIRQPRPFPPSIHSVLSRVPVIVALALSQVPPGRFPLVRAPCRGMLAGLPPARQCVPRSISAL